MLTDRPYTFFLNERDLQHTLPVKSHTKRDSRCLTDDVESVAFNFP